MKKFSEKLMKYLLAIFITGTAIAGIVACDSPALDERCVDATDNYYCVPGDYATINEAVMQLEGNGETILVNDGSYDITELLSIENKDLTIESINGKDSTTINVKVESTKRGIDIASGNITIRGFTFDGMGKADNGIAVWIGTLDVDYIIQDNSFKNFITSGVATGMAAEGFPPRAIIEGNTFVNSGYGITLWSSNGIVRNNTAVVGISEYSLFTIDAKNNLIENNNFKDVYLNNSTGNIFTGNSVNGCYYGDEASQDNTWDSIGCYIVK